MHTGGAYEEAAMRLKKSADYFDLPLEVVEMPDLGRWLPNAKQKARVIRDRWQEGQVLIFLDADAIIHRDPLKYLLNRNWATITSITPCRPRRFINTSCLAVGPDRISRRVLRRWNKAIDGRVRRSEDACLRVACDQFHNHPDFRDEYWPPEFAVRYERRSSISIDPEAVVISFNERCHPAKRVKPRAVPMPPLPWENE